MAAADRVAGTHAQSHTSFRDDNSTLIKIRGVAILAPKRYPEARKLSSRISCLGRHGWDEIDEDEGCQKAEARRWNTGRSLFGFGNSRHVRPRDQVWFRGPLKSRSLPVVSGPEELPTPTVVEVVTAENNELSILLHHAQKVIGLVCKQASRLSCEVAKFSLRCAPIFRDVTQTSTSLISGGGERFVLRAVGAAGELHRTFGLFIAVMIPVAIRLL